MSLHVDACVRWSYSYRLFDLSFVSGRNSPSLVPLVIYLGGKKDDCFVSW
jgi:hypothetical protein